MKIEGPSRSQQAGGTKKADKTSKSSSSFDDMVSSGSKEAGAAAPNQSIAMVDALLAVQGTEDPTERAARQRMRTRSDNLLKELDKIRMALLRGDITVGHVIDIADIVASHRENVKDPQLTSILDEIDLRAQIEIAKMRKAIEAQA